LSGGKKGLTSEGARLDGDGLPYPSDQKLLQLRTEGLAHPPQPSDWAHLTAMLRHAAEMGRKGVGHPDLPPGMTEIQKSLFAVIEFLQKQPVLMHDDAVGPLLRLQSAILDLANGKASPLFKPVTRKAGSPGIGSGEAMVIGLAAKAMSLLMEAGEDKKAASLKVAIALRASGGNYKDTKAKTVADWRDRIHEGAGSGRISDLAIETYNHPLEVGTKAAHLLGALRQATARGL
jgi:hypothetical protein